MIRRPPRSTLSSSSAASDVYKRQGGGKSKLFSPPFRSVSIHRSKVDCYDRGLLYLKKGRRPNMQLKPTAVIAVLSFVVASLLVTGCTDTQEQRHRTQAALPSPSIQ